MSTATTIDHVTLTQEEHDQVIEEVKRQMMIGEQIQDGTAVRTSKITRATKHHYILAGEQVVAVYDDEDGAAAFDIGSYGPKLSGPKAALTALAILESIGSELAATDEAVDALQAVRMLLIDRIDNGSIPW